MASFSTWRRLENRILKTRFISPYITKQQHQQKRNQSQKEKKQKTKNKKRRKRRKEPRKNQTHHLGRGKPQAVRAPGHASPRPRDLGLAWAPGHASLAAWAPGHASLAARAPSHASLAAWVAWPDPSRDLIWLFLSLSNLVSLSLIWLFLPLWSDPIRWGEAALETQSLKKKKFVCKSSLRDSILDSKIESLKLELLISYIVSKWVY